MELVFIVFMLGAGGALAVFVLTATAIAKREGAPRDLAMPQRDAIAASLLFHVMSAGGVGPEEALRHLRREAGLVAPVTSGIDVGNWAETYARAATPQQRTSLLECAVQLVTSLGRPVPVRQYAALLDLTFGLGFQTDALARLRQTYGFEYVDPAAQSRRLGSGTSSPFATRPARRRSDLARLLGISDAATRQEIGAAYRRLAAQHHPDRFHGATEAERAEAASRFIEVTRAYEELLALRD